MRILEISQTARARFAGLMLAEMGAEVIKIHSSGMDSEDAAQDCSAAFTSRRKLSVTLDFEAPAGKAAFEKLVETSDALLDDRDFFDFESLKALNPKFVLASILPYGASGPKKDWLATELTLQAASGLLQSTGWNDEAPTRLPGHTVEYIAGLNAAIAVLSALYGGEAAHLDISAQESTIQHLTRHIAQWSHTGTEITRYVRDLKGQASPIPMEASDGWIYFLALRPPWAEMAEFAGLNAYTGDEWAGLEKRIEHWDEIGTAFAAAVAGKDKYTWFDEGAAKGYTFAPIDDIDDILRSPQMAARGFFDDTDVDGSEGKVPNLPYSFETGTRRENKPPVTGEHNELVIKNWLGLSDQDFRAATGSKA